MTDSKGGFPAVNMINNTPSSSVTEGLVISKSWVLNREDPKLCFGGFSWFVGF